MATKYTKEDKKIIDETMQYIVEDMYKFLEISSKKYIIIYTDFLEYGDSSNIQINNNVIYLILYKYHDIPLWGINGQESELRQHKKIVLGKKTLKGIKACHGNYELYSTIIENYDTIRERLLKKANAFADEKDTKMDVINTWYNRFKKETMIEIDFPKTNNQHEIEVIEEDGKTIGIIDFGDKAIKIITSGDIDLKRKEKASPKIKQKI